MRSRLPVYPRESTNDAEHWSVLHFRRRRNTSKIARLIPIVATHRGKELDRTPRVHRGWFAHVVQPGPVISDLGRRLIGDEGLGERLAAIPCRYGMGTLGDTARRLRADRSP